MKQYKKRQSDTMASTAVAPAPTTEADIVQEKDSRSSQAPHRFPTADSHPEELAALTEDQQKKYDWLLDQVKAIAEVPSTKGKAGPLGDLEKEWLTRCLLRYLRATKWNEEGGREAPHQDPDMAEEYGVTDLAADHISPENETGGSYPGLRQGGPRATTSTWPSRRQRLRLARSSISSTWSSASSI